ncbi:MULTISPECIES: hypothetical protein [Bacillus cereus group]|uniref:Uncharacterized protein n=3 Tax=Bacillus toyonensis TaxID=155322 RepID=A0A2B5BRB5_9BACI|nr:MULTISPECIES: hypothetical protein [Bacillus cereus group]PEE33422.1 hypothetical protein CON59_25600 [Bacillus cereus]PEL15557.1 hypothetical protein CN624_31570 [Bacillus toyonensis]PEO40984.1 hypothetical protein CN579_34645 [Bacillus toyonensis]PET34905.1 hypothetical protein CN523_31160 [Bacillus cereus]PEV73824.1 hypothetical protein CN429_26705 [Bacillus cereus]
MLIEIIPIGESREVFCGPSNFTKVVHMAPNTIYIFTCVHDNFEVELGAFACGTLTLPSTIIIDRLSSGIKAVLSCGV